MVDIRSKPVIAIIGGTGDLGSGLAKKWAAAGYKVLIGSRSHDKAETTAQAIGNGAVGSDYVEAAKMADVVVVAVPYASHAETLREIEPVLSGKILVDAVVPLVPPKVSTVQLPAEGSAARQAKDIVGEGVRVVSAFHNVGAAKLHQGGRAECDVLVFGDDPDARALIVGLAGEVATRGVDGGVLANSVAAEALTSILIGINRRYKVAGAGIRITGLD